MRRTFPGILYGSQSRNAKTVAQTSGLLCRRLPVCAWDRAPRPGCLIDRLASNRHPGNTLRVTFHREQMKRQAAELAAKGIFIGTSSWKYPGWCGTLYE